MRYQGLKKLGKKAFCINFSLLEKLEITTKEAILLQQIDFVNNKSDFLVMPNTILSSITNMSRGHLYRCLNKLRKLDLIALSDEGICVTPHYLQLKEQDFKENHTKTKKRVKMCRANAGVHDSVGMDTHAHTQTNEAAKEIARNMWSHALHNAKETQAFTNNVYGIETLGRDKTSNNTQISNEAQEVAQTMWSRALSNANEKQGINNTMWDREGQERTNNIQAKDTKDFQTLSVVSTNALEHNAQQSDSYNEKIQQQMQTYTNQARQKAQNGNTNTLWHNMPKSAENVVCENAEVCAQENHENKGAHNFVSMENNMQNTQTICAHGIENKGVGACDIHKIQHIQAVQENTTYKSHANNNNGEQKSLKNSIETKQYHNAYNKEGKQEITQTRNTQSLHVMQEKSTYTKLQENTSAHKANTIQNMQEQAKNAIANAQNSNSFFETKMSQNETNLSQNETLCASTIYKTKNTNISLCANTHKEYIYFSGRKGLERMQEVRDTLASLKLNAFSYDKLESFVLESSIKNYVLGFFQAKAKQQKQNVMKKEVLERIIALGEFALLRDFMQELSKTLVFLSIKAKKEFFSDIEGILHTQGSLKSALEYAIQHKKLWICDVNSPDDSKGRHFLESVYSECLAVFDKELQSARKEGKKRYLDTIKHDKAALYAHLQHEYGTEISAFIAYRVQKGRHFNEAAFLAFLDTLAGYELQGRNVKAMIDQSIHRGYNWIFPLTHYKKKARKKQSA